MFETKHFKGDLFGGITAGIVALPLALAFGVQSGLGAIAGLYGAMVLGVFAALFGGTATQVSGPTGPMTVISAMVIASAIEWSGSLQSGMGIIVASFFLAGLFQVIFGFLGVGRYIKFIPYPVLSGFMTGIGVIIIIFQIYPFLGHASEKDTISVFQNIRIPLDNPNWLAILLGSATVCIIYLFPKITKGIPSALVALIAMTSISFIFQFDVPVIGEIPHGFPKFVIGSILNIPPNSYWPIVEFALMLAALGAIDSLLTSIIADNLTKTKHDSNRELMGQGLGNMLSSVIGGLPGAGATMRTVVNIKAGGKTRASGMIHGALLLAILLGIGKYAAYIPLSVLSGILITVGIGIIDYKGLRHLRVVPRADGTVLVIVLFLTIFGNLLYAVGTGVVLACILFMKRSSDLAESETSMVPLGAFDGEKPWSDEDSIYKKYQNKVFIKHLYGPLFFGFTSRFQEIIGELDKSVEVLVIRLDRVPYIDQTGIYALETIILELHSKGILVLLTGIHSQPMEMLRKIKIIPTLISETRFFQNFTQCEEKLKHYLSTQGAQADDF